MEKVKLYRTGDYVHLGIAFVTMILCIVAIVWGVGPVGARITAGIVGAMSPASFLFVTFAWRLPKYKAYQKALEHVKQL